MPPKDKVLKSIGMPYRLPMDAQGRPWKRIPRKRKKAAKAFVKAFYGDKEYSPDRPWPIPTASKGGW